MYKEYSISFMLTKSRKQLTARFLQRTVLFLTTYSGGLALFYLFGNAQDFQDSTQFLILAVLAATALLTTTLALILSLVTLGLFLARKRKRNLMLFCIGFACFAVVFAITLGSHVILLLSRGM